MTDDIVCSGDDLDRATAARIDASPNRLKLKGVTLRPPVAYLEMLGRMPDAKVVLTDSGGMQEETTALGVPCVALRENTERPITIEQGTNVVVGTDPARIRAVVDDIVKTGGKRGRRPELWEGHAAKRIAVVLKERFA